MDARDIAIRTILGEAAGEGPMGQAAVAHVLANRARDPRWPSTINEVALQPKQFSAWNSGPGGNDLVRKYGAGDQTYERVGLLYDAVMSGYIPDPTGGATHYYSPAAMQALADQGAQQNLVPPWFSQQTALRGSAPVTIGGHIFTGSAGGPQQVAVIPQQMAAGQPEIPPGPQASPMGMLRAMPEAPPPPPPPQLAPMPQGLIKMPQRSDRYGSFFRSL